METNIEEKHDMAEYTQSKQAYSSANIIEASAKEGQLKVILCEVEQKMKELLRANRDYPKNAEEAECIIREYVLNHKDKSNKELVSDIKLYAAAVILRWGYEW